MNIEFSIDKYEDLLESGKFKEASAYRASFIPDVLYKFMRRLISDKYVAASQHLFAARLGFQAESAGITAKPQI